MEKINMDFKNTCRIVFGTEIGELPEFAPYLSEMLFPFSKAKSSLSGKEVVLTGHHYPPSAEYASQDELGMGAPAPKPLSINDIKDIDSLFEAASERAVYCGNKGFGTNMDVTMSDNAADCFNVHSCFDTYNLKNSAYCSIGRLSENLFGVSMFRGCSHLIRSFNCGGSQPGAARSFETYMGLSLAECYYVFGCSGCSNCMFSFNLRNKSHCIGNLQLTKEKYFELKKKLVGEIAEILKKDKRIFSIADIVAGKDAQPEEVEMRYPPAPPASQKAFASASKVVLGSEHNVDKLAPWLMEKTLKRAKVAGYEGKMAFWVDLPVTKKIPHSRLAGLEVALASSGRTIRLEDGDELGKIAKKAAEIAVFTIERTDGNAINATETVIRMDCSNIHSLWGAVSSQNCAFSTLDTESKYIFGGFLRILHCDFCINCFNTTKCKNCLECDSCYTCRNCYFCHNCENVEEGILCFNLKGARYAILNQSVSKEEYMRVKKMLLDYMNSELEEKGKLERSIFALALPHLEAKKGGKSSKPV